jgi:hypothetical protein
MRFKPACNGSAICQERRAELVDGDKDDQIRLGLAGRRMNEATTPLPPQSRLRLKYRRFISYPQCLSGLLKK